jgi:hypothetical protein
MCSEATGEILRELDARAGWITGTPDMHARYRDSKLVAVQYLHNNYPGLSNEVVDELATQAVQSADGVDWSPERSN